MTKKKEAHIIANYERRPSLYLTVIFFCRAVDLLAVKGTDIFISTRFESYTGIDRVALRKLLNYAVLIVIRPCFLNSFKEIERMIPKETRDKRYLSSPKISWEHFNQYLKQRLA